MELYAAIDLHSNNSVLAVLDDSRTVVYERRLPNDLSVILDALLPFRDRLQGIAVESTYNWYWLVDGLQDAGVRVHLVNTAAVQQYGGLKHGDDHSDARWLAQLLQLGLLPEGFICPRGLRAARDLLRRRMLLVHQGVQLMLSMESMLARRTGRTASVNTVRTLDATTITATLLIDLICAYLGVSVVSARPSRIAANAPRISLFSVSQGFLAVFHREVLHAFPIAHGSIRNSREVIFLFVAWVLPSAVFGDDHTFPRLALFIGPRSKLGCCPELKRALHIPHDHRKRLGKFSCLHPLPAQSIDDVAMYRLGVAPAETSGSQDACDHL